MTYYLKEGIKEMEAKRLLKYSDEIINEAKELREQGMTYPNIKKYFKKCDIEINVSSIRARINLEKQHKKYNSDAEILAKTDDANKKYWQSILYNPILSYDAISEL